MPFVQGTNGLAPAEGLLGALADAVAYRAAPDSVSGAPVDGRAPLRGVLGHVRGGIASAQCIDEVGGIAVAIGTHHHAVISGKAGDPVHGGRAFSHAAGRGQLVIHDWAIADFHQDVALVARLCIWQRLLRYSHAVGSVSAVGVSLLRLSPGEVSFGVTPGAGSRGHRCPWAGTALSEPKPGSGCRRPRSAGRAAAWPGRLCHALTNWAPVDIRLQKPDPVLSDGGMIPNRIVPQQSD